MQTLSLVSLNLARTVEQLSPWPMQHSPRNETHHSPDLLQCTQREADDEAPDRRFWTAYDHFMAEREARAKRREYVYRLMAKAWRRLIEGLPRARRRTSAQAARGN